MKLRGSELRFQVWFRPAPSGGDAGRSCGWCGCPMFLNQPPLPSHAGWCSHFLKNKKQSFVQQKEAECKAMATRHIGTKKQLKDILVAIGSIKVATLLDKTRIHDLHAPS
ncbi:hypothetical protein E3N88_29107 [Mikania micrantha]|uniref:Uncharacterized protein n=1 Tax=Mikania micrantha TaxID=192012 RepID=A0A5N6N2F0_9ASTR|nr:hypothetical protein E3N88_29107 [Mikania micrantha]